MTPAALEALVARLAADVAAGRQQTGEPANAPVSRYLDPAWLERERRTLFLGKPLILAHASELAAPGSCLRHDALGVPLLLTRDGTGRVHGFLNVCRHRGMRLVDEAGCERRTLVCPYHGWTYELDGRLRHVPHAEAFGAPPAGLTPIAVEERAGLVWGVARPHSTLDLDAWLGPLGEELAYFGVPDAGVFRTTDLTRACNWKLIVEAFLEAYHIRVLHRDTIWRFFIDSAAASDVVGVHVRSAAARRRITETATLPKERWDLREHCTFTHFLFPNAVFIFHPDYTSLITLYPQAPDRVRWVHRMLVPRERLTPESKPHWDKSHALIEDGVFQAEDLRACESIQAGLASGANDRLTFGRLEFLLGQFHRTIDAELERAGA